jgi:hypothetical protein
MFPTLILSKSIKDALNQLQISKVSMMLQDIKVF